ncbi:T9SS type A sorting domain-containing protein [Neolewinella agarilytica]|uniref:T9SS type A sorting domain-containing protein n=1 Tax=Neolewinella agarilytica TaxID=478744 RepID=UPI002352AE47|nr:HmuY family protein [Neolewinella agarilytica]
MRSATTFLLVFLLLPTVLLAQFEQVIQGPGYASAVYVDLQGGTSSAVSHTSWDIAFNVGGRSSGILVNEGVASSQANPLLQVELYAGSATDFSTADTNQVVQRLYNGEGSWDDGGFNAIADPGNPFDLGWGTYSPATQTVFGSRVFFVATRDGAYHKVFVESLAGGVYTFIHGPLGGSTSDTVSIDKADFVGKTLAYFSFDDGVLDLEPDNWDLLFTRYVTPLPDGEGNILDYTVTGVLQNKDVSVAKLSGVDPETAVAPADEATFSDSLATIGYDWKSFDLSTFQWSIPDDLVYFVQTPDSLYRMQFIDFEGSSTGVSTFRLSTEQTTATTTLPVGIDQSRIYPNPAPDQVTLEVSARQPAEDLRLEVIDPAGRTLTASRVRALNTGLNQIDVPLTDLPAGHYFVRLSGSTGVLTHHLIKQ